jgi:hypothetical protein
MPNAERFLIFDYEIIVKLLPDIVFQCFTQLNILP